MNNKQSRYFNRIVILGHSGFIGGHLYNYLTKKFKDTNVEVLGASSAQINLLKLEETYKLRKWFNLQTIVILCSCIKRQYGEDSNSFLKNVHMVTNICQVLEDHPVKNFIYMSSGAVYGEDVPHLLINEETGVHPTSFYGIAKYTSERLLKKITGHNLTVLRIPTVYGPGDRANYGPSGFVHAIINEQEITLWGDGKELREFLFIDDVIKLIDKFIAYSFNGVVNLVSGTSYSFLQIIDCLMEQITLHNIPVNSCVRSKEKVNTIFDNKKLRNIFADFQFTGLCKGVSLTYNSTLEAEIANKER